MCAHTSPLAVMAAGRRACLLLRTPRRPAPLRSWRLPPSSSTVTSLTPDSNDGEEKEETIAAVVTGGGGGAVGIVRLSGPGATRIARRVFVPSSKGFSPASLCEDLGKEMEEGYAYEGEMESHKVLHGYVVAFRPEKVELVDEVLLLPMLAPRSYTREDVVELQCHGGSVAPARILAVCLEEGARLAQPGEFTQRAFLNGRIDLTQAEAVAEIVGARTPAAADMALAGVGGAVCTVIEEIRSRVLHLVVGLEARLDFEDDVTPVVEAETGEEVRCIIADVEKALATAARGRVMRNGAVVAILGRPNVGKSSLLNRLIGSERAIVTPMAGTTRDVVEGNAVLQGIPVRLLDTAGLRDAVADEVEAQGVQRSLAAARVADVVLMVIDGSEGWTEADIEVCRSTLSTEQPALLVVNKVDKISLSGENNSALHFPPPPPPEVSSFLKPEDAMRVSATTSEGIDQLCSALTHELLGKDSEGGGSFAVNERQEEGLLRTKDALQRVCESVEGEMPLDCWTVDLRDALLHLSEVSGGEVTEEVLDGIFSSFCIGK